MTYISSGNVGDDDGEEFWLTTACVCSNETVSDQTSADIMQRKSPQSDLLRAITHNPPLRLGLPGQKVICQY